MLQRPLGLVFLRGLLGGLRGELGLLGVGCCELAAEAVDTACGVDQFLLAGEERMAGCADFYDDGPLVGGACVELVTAGALYVRVFVVGVNGCLWHDLVLSSSPAPVWFRLQVVGSNLRRCSCHAGGLGPDSRGVRRFF